MRQWKGIDRDDDCGKQGYYLGNYTTPGAQGQQLTRIDIQGDNIHMSSWWAGLFRWQSDYNRQSHYNLADEFMALLQHLIGLVHSFQIDVLRKQTAMFSTDN